MNIVECWAITTIIIIFIIATVFGLVTTAIICGVVMKKKIDKNYRSCYNKDTPRERKEAVR